jgi:peptide/nickel transport system ATP-binding protein/oligopeptide transport system ATP-binding protein
LLKINDLEAGFQTPDGYLPALRGINLEVYPGETLALVGESGCGKTLTAYSILRLLEPPAKILAGSIFFEKDNVIEYSETKLNQYRGGQAAMIFQEPMSALNPVFTIGAQITEVITTHTKDSGAKARARAIQLLNDVGIQNPEQRIDSYPFELSGGMRQRAMIAMALAVSPRLLIADEPTTSLDVTIQAQILDLLQKLSEENNMSVLLITHDLGIVSQAADRVAIMYSGQIMETGPVQDIIANPKHPYTQGLLNSLPSMALHDKVNNRLKPIPGTVPSLKDIPSGCPFRPRCSKVMTECSQEIKEKGNEPHQYRCLL